MEHGEELDPPPVEPASPQGRDALRRLEQPLQRRIAQADHDTGAEQQKLGLQEAPAHQHLLLRGRAVARRTALHHVADEDRLPLNAPRAEDLRQKLPRLSHEGQAGGVLVRAGPLPHKDEGRIHRALTKDRVRPRLAQAAAPAPGHAGPKLLPCLVSHVRIHCSSDSPRPSMSSSFKIIQ